MKEAFLSFERRLNGLSLAAACLMMGVAASLGMFQIITRFVLEQPAEWSEVLTRFALIWMVFLGIPTAFRHGSMVSVDVLRSKLTGSPQRALEALVALGALVLLGLMIRVGYDYAWRGRVQTIIGLESFSMTWAYAAIPVGSVFAVFGVVANWFDPRREELDTAQ